ncbi:MAG TPA: lysylphosphatidylglycerol synthase domain-containing protein [Mycobacteriales bacterium]|nr:lysylphosphatidylglycerol synthase domain-containing protein [Mycobacteriales bacterium]
MRPVLAAARRLPQSRLARVLAVVLAVSVAAVNLGHLPRLDIEPVVYGLLPWVVGKYVLCPLRWHGISASGKSRRWHLRVYAESELLGLLTPAHAGTDLWRVHQLRGVGMDSPSAFADVALDRLLGAIGLTVFVILAGATLPPQVLLAAGGIAVVVLVAALLIRQHRPGLLAKRPLPPTRKLAHGLGLSLCYQLTIMGLLFGGLSATGHTVAPLALLGVFGASQVAGIIPGVQGAGPKEGALVAGLVGLGVPFGSALGAVSLISIAAWAPALLLGGTCLFVSRHLAKQARGALAAA